MHTCRPKEDLFVRLPTNHDSLKTCDFMVTTFVRFIGSGHWQYFKIFLTPLFEIWHVDITNET